MKLKSFFALPFVLLLAACSATGPVLIASLGLAGAGLVTYCTAAGTTCPASVVTWGAEIVKEATEDAVVWESGGTTANKVATIITNLNVELGEGRLLTGLSQQAQAQVSAILTTISALIPLFEALISPPPASGEVVFPAVTSKEKAAFTKMRDTASSVVTWQ